MQDDERRALGKVRRLVFQNLANGVPSERVCEDMKLSLLEVDQARQAVAKKITEYLTLRRQAPIMCDTVPAIRWNRRGLLGVLARIGDLDLGSALILARVTIQALDHPEMIEGAAHRMNNAYGRNT